MARRDATEEELLEIWDGACTFWNTMKGSLDRPWVEARFKLATFKTTIEQKGLKIPIKLGML